MQIRYVKLEYMKSPFNIIQTSTILINSLCICFGLFLPQDYLMSQDGIYCSAILPAIGAFFLVIQLVYWSTLFESTSFYVTLVIQSGKDIIAFMVILMIILLAFTSGVFVINYNYKKSHEFSFDSNEQEYHDLISPRFNNQFFDALYVQWLLGLGEFEMLGSTDEGEESF